LKSITKRILRNKIIQRVIYTLGLVVWTLILSESLMNFPNAKSSIKITYLTLYLIPAIILFFQIIRNNKILWSLIFGLFSSFILISLIMGISDWIERSGNHVKRINWTLKEIIILLLYFTILVGIDWIIFKIKPERLI